MRLLTKLTLFNTFSKIAIVTLFVILLPFMVTNIAFRFTNFTLQEQKKKVLDNIQKNGIEYYLQGDRSYGSYTMLKEEYVSLVEADGAPLFESIETSRRIVEGDTLTYRVLNHSFDYGKKRYTLEIGKTTASIIEYNSLLQRFALYVLMGLIAGTLLIDLFFTRYLLKPLGTLIRTKLLNPKFPFKEHFVPLKTSTTDFEYLDRSLIELMSKINETFDKEREFTSNASHELMTPISLLQTNLENMMISGDLEEGMANKIMDMMKTLNRLKKIVHSLLFISRIENEQFVKTGEVKIHELIVEMLEELDHRMEAKQIQFEMKISESLKLRNLNRDLLFQLVYNIINNAIRYNVEGGQIIVSDHLLPGKSYTLYIKDTGIGIPENEMSNIFERFKKSNRSEEEGYGLGLYIVKTIAQNLALTLEVKSAVNKGTIFSILFPADTLTPNSNSMSLAKK
jgi:two-component system sensor histidine kinase ArlS